MHTVNSYSKMIISLLISSVNVQNYYIEQFKLRSFNKKNLKILLTIIVDISVNYYPCWLIDI
jgi:hypothetical protein